MNFNLKLIIFENRFQFSENIVKAPFLFKIQLNTYFMLCSVVLKKLTLLFFIKICQTQ